jgi:iron complex transport system substrate-binding protein
MKYMGQYYAEETCLEKLADRFNLSPVHFRRRLKQYTDNSPQEFIIAMRISRAKELLSQGYPIKDVPGRVGYDDIFYFMRIFKKVTGITPGKFTFIHTRTITH